MKRKRTQEDSFAVDLRGRVRFPDKPLSQQTASEIRGQFGPRKLDYDWTVVRSYDNQRASAKDCMDFVPYPSERGPRCVYPRLVIIVTSEYTTPVMT